MYRILTKAYGLEFIILVTGKMIKISKYQNSNQIKQFEGRAGKFDFIPLFLSIGSGIGLCAIPVLISDFLLLNFTKKRKFYNDLKEFDYKKRTNERSDFNLSVNMEKAPSIVYF